MRATDLFSLSVDRLIYGLARMLVTAIQALPLGSVTALGRACGWLAYYLDARHRRVALRQIEVHLGEGLHRAGIRRLARENFMRIGENFAASIRTAAMSGSEIDRILEMDGLDHLEELPGAAVRSRVFAVGHFGNFELYARCTKHFKGSSFATTFRALRQPSLNRLLQELRAQSGCLYFERRTEAEALRKAMKEQSIFVGFLADQHAGDHGVRVPFLARECSASPAPAVFALRYDAPLHVAICYRVQRGRWRIEVGPEIPTTEAGRRRSVESITRDVQAAFEVAVKRDPANWFWVHNRWKAVKRPWRAERCDAAAPAEPAAQGAP